MRKIIFIVFAIVFIGVLDARESYTIEFDASDFLIEDTESGSLIYIDDLAYFYLEDTALPALPYRGVAVLIPYGNSISNLSFKTKKIEFCRGIDLAHNPLAVPVSSGLLNYNSIDDISLKKYSDNIYPETNVKFQQTHQIQGFTMASFIICPFIYDVNDRSLHLLTEFNFEFDYIDTFHSEKGKSASQRYDMRWMVENMVLNPKDLPKLYPLVETVHKSGSTGNVDQVDYLIITAASLVGAFAPLKEWKIRKGLRTEIFSTDYIYSQYADSADTDQLRIKYFLRDYYEDKGLKWVLLGGDDTVVPVQECYARVGTDHIRYDIPCDMFYACFDKAFDWNYDNDSIIGEFYDSIDYCPEIYISRVPIRTSTHVDAFVNKTLKYEQNPDTSGYINTMLLSGVKINLVRRGVSDAQNLSELLYTKHIAFVGSEWTGVKKRFYDTETDFPGGADYDVTAVNLQAQLDSGYHFVHMTTHGGTAAWEMEYINNMTRTYRSDDAFNLTNSNSSIILTTACFTNRFDSDQVDPCLSEAFIRNPNGGCVAYWGSSREGWSGFNFNALWPSLRYSASFFNTLFGKSDSKGYINPDYYKFGATTAFAKLANTNKLYTSEADRWLQFSLNAIGDPELPIYTNNPQVFTNAVISQSGTTITVNTGGVTGCTIALTSMDSGASYFEVCESDSVATFTDVLCPYYIVITKHNYIPFRYQQDDVYIQNHTFSSDTYISGCNIFVGENVLPFSPQGKVTIQNGAHVIFEADSRVFLKGGFESEPGGTFEIK